ncbi:MAG: hypothetical protein R3B07_26710 [Polyangiaceae bacterium]
MDDELRPLLAGDLAPELRSALESGLEDGPSLESMQAAALALGLSAGATKAAAAGAAGQGLLKGASSSWLLKWFGIGLLVGGVSSSGVALVKSQAAAPTEPSASAVEANSPPPTHAVFQPAAPESPRNEPAAPTLDDAEPARRSAARGDLERTSEAPESADSAPSAASFPSTIRQADLRAEVQLIDAARRSLNSGNAQGALLELGRYDALVGPKRLAPEALVLRVRALSQIGRTQEARALAEPVIANQPDSAQARQLRRALGPD